MVDVGGGLVEQALIVLKGFNKQQSLMHSMHHTRRICFFILIFWLKTFTIPTEEFRAHLIGGLFCFGQFMSDG